MIGYFLSLATQLCLTQTYLAAFEPSQIGDVLFSDGDSPFKSVRTRPVAILPFDPVHAYPVVSIRHRGLKYGVAGPGRQLSNTLLVVVAR